ncbi:Cyclic di-GMP phosphodiesterase PdeB [Burkholderia sp. AD24]|nr:Cyclic di-GMP phosphodiesterase PdeB [Burkholderia sp. AD24]
MNPTRSLSGVLKSDAEKWFSMLYEAIPVMLHSIDAMGRLVRVSDVWLSTLGYERIEVLGRPWTDFLAPECGEFISEIGIPYLFRNGSCSKTPLRIVRKDGTLIDILLAAVVANDGDGSPFSLTVVEDVTEWKRTQTELIAQRERLRVTLDSIGDGVITTDQRGVVEYLNPVAERLTGWSNGLARGASSETVFRIVEEGSRTWARNPVDICIAESRVACSSEQVVLRSQNGREYCVESCAAPIVDATGQFMGVVLVFRDVSEQRRLHHEIQYRATHDALTGIFNRTEFDRRLRHALNTALDTSVVHALLYIDLDQFKLANDIGGHTVGDKLLKQVVGIVKGLVRSNDIFGRLGGDEFGLILERCGLEDAQKVAQQICDELDAFRFQHGSHSLHVGASIGLVLIDRHWTNAVTLLQAADQACYAAKQAGRNRVHRYFVGDEAIEAHRDDTLSLKRLESALNGGHFVLHWQRIRPLTADGGGVHGEILLRMLDENKTLIPPGAFIPAAERFQMVSRIDRWVIRHVFEWMAKHRADLSHVESLGINLSGVSVGDRDFHRYVHEMIETFDFDHDKLCFEITETAAISNMSDALSFLNSMHAHGVRFALDDFGSGVSSFGYLKRLPVEFLKIDGQFIRGLFVDPVDQAAVKCICEIAKITGKKTVAECVETEAVESLLRTIGVDYAQGFLRHRPVDLDQIFDHELLKAEP